MASRKVRPASKQLSKKTTRKPESKKQTSNAKDNRRTAVKSSAKQPKPKPATGQAQKKRRVYTEKELGIPKLNMITPAGIQKPKGKKKGKIFVDDPDSLATIIALVNAEKEGQIESKIMKSRQMEEIRQAREREMAARQQEKKAKLEESKRSIRGKRRIRDITAGLAEEDSQTKTNLRSSKKKKVTFG